MERLYAYMQDQLKQVDTSFHRYTYDQLHWDSKMFGLVGPRGVGKTTLFLQYIKEHYSNNEALYVAADHIYFSTHTLYDTAETFYKNGGTYLFIDEVHKYTGWSTELKMMYDGLPDLKVRFTGSSILDIKRGEADLSRRAPLHTMQGLSFREFLAIRHGIDAPVLSLEQVLDNQIEIADLEHPLPLFKEYLKNGYYPFGADEEFELELSQVINNTLELDIPVFSGMTTSTGIKLKKLMAIIATLVPFKPNMSDLAKRIQVSRNSMEDYLTYLERAGMIAQLKTGASGLGALGKVEKVYLDNPNMLYVLGDGKEDIGNVRETFFLNQMRVNNLVVSSPISDFQIDDMTFEVGGKNKGKKQIEGAEKGYVVKDDIEFGYGNVMPLWAFGLNY